MIPTRDTIKQLWNTYQLPEGKRQHVALVAKVAVFLGQRIMENNPDIRINISLLEAAALVHDIDKAIPYRDGEHHPDAGVRVLREMGMNEVADIVATHPVHMIVSSDKGPSSWEEKILFIADKMVKQEVITVDKRFALWLAEPLPQTVKDELQRVYPSVKKLEKEIFGLVRLEPAEIANMI